MHINLGYGFGTHSNAHLEVAVGTTARSRLILSPGAMSLHMLDPLVCSWSVLLLNIEADVSLAATLTHYSLNISNISGLLGRGYQVNRISTPWQDIFFVSFPKPTPIESTKASFLPCPMIIPQQHGKGPRSKASTWSRADYIDLCNLGISPKICTSFVRSLRDPAVLVSLTTELAVLISNA